MALLDNNEGDSGFVVGFQLDTGFTDGGEFMLKYLQELSF